MGTERGVTDAVVRFRLPGLESARLLRDPDAGCGAEDEDNSPKEDIWKVLSVTLAARVSDEAAAEGHDLA